jgi:phenylalanyl-tRNA synthetase beta chain
MKISFNWLRELVDLPGHPVAEDVAKVLTKQGLEVEGIVSMGTELVGVKVAEVLAVRAHPTSEKLRLVVVRAGEEQAEVVCGAPNVPPPGGRVCWAPPGACLPGGMVLDVREVRGVSSPGMLCGESELGFSDNHEGILVLDSSAVSGEDLAGYLGARDDIFEVNVTPNRGDALSHWGIARELGAHFGCALHLPSVNGIPETSEGPLPDVQIVDTEGCPRYLARTLVGLTIAASPIWMRLRLSYCGMRPISNLVDVTNYVLLEMGHPLHAFDLKKVAGTIRVRRAHPNERMITLDGQDRLLAPTDLLITDEHGPIALAGVMGGASTEVTQTTTSILLEAATFEPRSIRKTAKRLGLASEASYRFERVVDAQGVPFASLRACSLLAKLASGRLVAQGLDRYPRPHQPVRISLSTQRLRRLTGCDYRLEAVESQLTRLGFKCTLNAEELLTEVPSYRSDIAIPEDLVEEFLRMGEYENPTAVQRIQTNATSAANPESLSDRVRFMLAGTGFSEIVSWAFVPKTALQTISGGGKERALADGIALINPLSADYEVMRTSLLPGLASAVKHNLSRGNSDPWLFEVGPVIRRSPEKKHEASESPHVAGLMVGKRVGWLKSEDTIDYYDLKRIVDDVLRTFAEGPFHFHSGAEVPFLHPGISARITSTIPHGLIGQIHPGIAKNLEIEVPAFYFELWLDSFIEQIRGIRSVSPPRFPAVTRDISFWIDADIPAEVQQLALANNGESLLVEHTVLEDFRDTRYVPPGKKGMLWSLTYRSAERTLTDAEVDSAHARVVAAFSAALSIQIR